MNSQFTIYTSADAGAPILNASTGSLISVLDWCLITGSKWLKPLPNSGSGATIGWGTGSIMACYQQPSGSGRILVVNDGAPYGTTNSGTKEAWVAGYETLLTLSASTYMTTSIGSGYGQFPNQNQILYGNKVVRKANGNTGSAANGVPWILFADPSTFYMFHQCGAPGYYTHLWFGDIFSFGGSSDNYKCMISARNFVNSDPPISTTQAEADSVFGLQHTVQLISNLITYLPMMINRSYTGMGGASGIGCFAYMHSDLGKAVASLVTTTTLNSRQSLAGALATPSPIDGSLYLCPLSVGEMVNSVFLRGRVRGIYQVCHPISNFVDGQTINGANDFAGKTFRIVRLGMQDGMWAIETSNTVETN